MAYAGGSRRMAEEEALDPHYLGQEHNEPPLRQQRVRPRATGTGAPRVLNPRRRVQKEMVTMTRTEL